ncbi:hypothetical protein [Brevibacterium album]|uniref:hypothetical protein n=1 Tax=Brevibacterium album TaxID=417948 RepID=UPI0003FD3697|nr:hypothetical protein [Brevibacterium album]
MSQMTMTPASEPSRAHGAVPRGRRAARTRLGLGAAALSALALSACGGGEGEAEFAEESAAPEVVGEQVEQGFLYEDISQNVTVTDTLRPERGEIITPTGTLTVNEVQAVSAVPAEEIEREAVTDEETGEPLDYIAAEGEELRVVDLTFTPHGDQEDLYGGEHESGTTSELSIRAGGAQNHLQPLGSQADHRILVSAPEDGSTHFVVSSEGHDQYVDVLTGERQEDDVAAAYYRPVTTQEPHHTFPVDDSEFTVLYNGSEDGEGTVSYDLQVASASLTAWTQDGGWAAPGEAWLAVDWNYEAEAGGGSGAFGIEELAVKLSVDVDGTVTEDESNYQSGSFPGFSADDEVTTFASVPIDTTDVAVSLSGDVRTGLSDPYSLTEETAEFSTEELAISFPLTGDGAAADPSAEASAEAEPTEGAASAPAGGEDASGAGGSAGFTDTDS